MVPSVARVAGQGCWRWAGQRGGTGKWQVHGGGCAGTLDECKLRSLPYNLHLRSVRRPGHCTQLSEQCGHISMCYVLCPLGSRLHACTTEYHISKCFVKSAANHRDGQSGHRGNAHAALSDHTTAPWAWCA